MGLRRPLDGHGDHANQIIFPYWLVTALQWAVDIRDPLSSGHGYAQAVMNWSPMISPDHGLPWDTIKTVGGRVFGSDLATDPESGYAWKAEPAVFEGHRSMLKDSLTLDDQMFPRLFSKRTDDGYARAGDMEGPDFEWHMFTAATGLDLSPEEFMRSAERAFNLERVIQIQRFGRSRQDDECIIPYLETEENLVNPFLGTKQSLDRAAFLGLLDQYYDLRGWDRASGWPTPAKLAELGLSDVTSQLYPAK
jgi:aldehyde:ferredoxin oxidoreductase